MKTIFTLCLLLVAFTTFGQRKLAVSVTGGPTYWYSRNTEYLPTGVQGNPPATTFGLLTYGGDGYGFNVGVLAHYALGRRWSVSTGVLYARSTANFGFMQQAGQPDPSIWRTRTYQVPLLVNYSPPGRLAPYVSVGGMSGFASVSTVRNSPIFGPDETRIRLRDEFGVQPVLGVGAIYRATERVALVVQPMLIYNLRTERRQPGERFLGYQANLQAQLRYTF